MESQIAYQVGLDEARLRLDESLKALIDARADVLAANQKLRDWQKEYDDYAAGIIAEAWETGKITGSNAELRKVARDAFLATHEGYQRMAATIVEIDDELAQAKMRLENASDAFVAARMVIGARTAEVNALAA